MLKNKVILSTLLLITIGAVAAIVNLQATATASRDAELKIAKMQLELNELQDIPWQAIPAQGGRPDRVRQQFEAARARFEKQLVDLTGDGVADAQLARAAAEFRQTIGPLRRIIEFASRNDPAGGSPHAGVAWRYQQQASKAMVAAGRAYRANGERALQRALYGSAAALALLFGAFAFFFRRAARARRVAEQLARQKQRSEAHLAQAQRLARVGSWEWRAAEDRLTWSAEQARLHDWPHAEPPTGATAALALIDPDDRPKLAAALDAAREADAPLALDYRVNTADGARIVHCQGEALRDADGRWIGLIGTCQDVTDRFRRAEAERANQAKSEFLSRMSHELRTPLNAVLGFGQLLATSELDDRQRANVDQILTAGRHLLTLINEVLNLSRIEAGELTISLEPIHLATVLDDTIDLIAPLAAAQRVTLTTPADETDAWVHADQQRLKQVLLNLLSNAVKYNREDGQVHVRVERPGNDRVRIVVADTGAGIAPDMLPRLFNPFERLGAEHSDIEGTGLGLSLSKSLVEAMGGTIDVTSTPGAGSAFTVELGAADPIQPPAALPTGIAHAGAIDGGTRTLLCIEDNVANLELIEQIFAARPDIELLTAVQGTIGAELARRHRPDLVLLDLNLPDIDGHKVLERLHADPATEHLPVVILSADPAPTRAPARARRARLPDQADRRRRTPARRRRRTPRPQPLMTSPLTDMRLLIVDDNAANVAVLEQLLDAAGYSNVLSTRDARAVAALCASWRPDLVLLDLHMPHLSGFEVLAAIADQLGEPVNLPVLVLTADATPDARRRALSQGARDFVTKPLDHAEVLLRVRNLLHTRHLQQRLQDRNLILADAVHERTEDLEQARLEALTVLAAATEYRDDDTHQHTQRVGHTAALIAQALDLPEPAVATIRDAAPLHDIGKIGLPDHILLKPGRLTPEERAAMQRHVEIGARILAPARSPVLRAAAEIARTHHEHWDGNGYLAGLQGEDIPLAGRITAVADVFDALAHQRPYKPAWPLERAVATIAQGAGQQFDPRVAHAFATLDHATLINDTATPQHQPLPA
jgi:response regulator RpfG family c-di-GMP phosphodiesterase/signal transduction histidine kinase